ncbi:MAG: NnrS family protein [Pseudomonadota bacterium]
MSVLLRLEEPAAPAAPRRFALWELGFRPLYLLASAYAALSVALWGAQSLGWLPWAYLQGPAWHAHEMLFGFTLAVVVGFLFTAGRNWSGQPTPTGRGLMALALLWLAARLLMLTPIGWLAAAANLAFAWGSAWGLGRALLAGGNKRNYFFVALLVAMGLASLAVQLALLGWVPLPAWAGLQLGLDIVLFIMAVMGGRVIPMFTNNGVPGTQAVRKPWVEKAALGSVLLLLALDLGGVQGTALGVVLLLASAVHLARLLLWQPWRTLRTPLVWVLHAAYLWIPLHLALRAGAQWGAWAPSIAVHALTVGAIGGLIVGMMTRTARGHTARLLRADRFDVACYALVLCAAVVRVGVPLAVPAAYGVGLALSALLWSAGFGLFALRYWPVLTRARLDGKPG